MSITVVQHKSGSNATAGTSFTVAYSSNNAQGNCLVVVAGNFDGTHNVSSITDSNNVWPASAAIAFNDSTNAQGLSIWALLNCAAGANTITVNLASSMAPTIEIYEISGLFSIGPNSTGGSSGSVTTMTTGAITLTNPNAIAIA